MSFGGRIMTEVVSGKNRIGVGFEKVKSKERDRAERVQGIVKEAFSQAVVEVKEGTGEIRAIAQDALTVTVDDLKQKGNNLKQNFTTPLDGEAEAEKLKGQLTWLGRQLAVLDTWLSARFNERFSVLKQRTTEKAQAWYGSLSEEKQAELEDRVTGIKMTLIEKQQQIRQQLRAVLQSTAAKL
jgi:hypothetical protein